MDNNGIIIPHPHSHPPGMRLFPRICLNAAAGTLKMIIYLLNVGDTRGEQCSPLIGPLIHSQPLIGQRLHSSEVTNPGGWAQEDLW